MATSSGCTQNGAPCTCMQRHVHGMCLQDHDYANCTTWSLPPWPGTQHAHASALPQGQANQALLLPPRPFACRRIPALVVPCGAAVHCVDATGYLCPDGVVLAAFASLALVFGHCWWHRWVILAILAPDHGSGGWDIRRQSHQLLHLPCSDTLLVSTHSKHCILKSGALGSRGCRKAGLGWHIAMGIMHDAQLAQ